VPTLSAYDYAYVRVVPQVELGACFNVGVILYCRPRRFLAARILADEAYLQQIVPMINPLTLRQHLELIPRICAGEGPIGRLGQADAFHWLVHPHSTVIQTSPVHTGLCQDPAEALEALAQSLKAQR
jgi:hypothetical protein